MASTWTTWSDTQPELPAAARTVLARELGPLTASVAAPLSAAAPAPSRLRRDVVERLKSVVDHDGLHLDDETRALHAGGQSYVDIARRRRGDAGAAPDAVVTPADADAVARVLRVCAQESVAVVPWGGGTSVVGGLDPERGGLEAVVALDLSRLDALVAVDPESRLATFQPGIRTPAAEAALAGHGLTLGHVPQSFERASLGGYVVTRSAGQASTGVGRIDDLVAGLRMATPTGELVLSPVAGSAAGPDLRRLVLGSEGTLGVVTEVTLRVRTLPETRHYEGWMLPDWDTGLGVLRALIQDGPHPDIARLSDPQETAISLLMSRSGRMTRTALSAYLRVRRVSGGCLLITGYEGGPRDVRHRRGVIRHALRQAGAVSLGVAAGRSWEHARFAAPALRDTLFDAGVLAETLETAATWTALPAVYAAVRAAVTESLGRAVVGCHVSHLYPTGASLYFTVLAAAEPGDAADAQWLRAKAAANDAIVVSGGTISHHHAVGTAHRGHVSADLGGDLGVRALRAVKRELDPRGVMNPGKLLP
jgi:alkyldihydroxyacetonephosphate synthase